MGVSTLFVTLVHVSCYKCGVVFGVEQSHQTRLLGDHGDFYCPNGHCQHYTGKTEVEKRAERAEQNATFYQRRAESAEREAKVQRNRANAQKAAKSRLKNKIAKGHCPCCERTFSDLAGHMAKEHPKYGQPADVVKS